METITQTKKYTVTITEGSDSLSKHNGYGGVSRPVPIYEQVIERDLDIPGIVRALNSEAFEVGRMMTPTTKAAPETQ